MFGSSCNCQKSMRYSPVWTSAHTTQFRRDIELVQTRPLHLQSTAIQVIKDFSIWDGSGECSETTRRERCRDCLVIDDIVGRTAGPRRRSVLQTPMWC